MIDIEGLRQQRTASQEDQMTVRILGVRPVRRDQLARLPRVEGADIHAARHSATGLSPDYEIEKVPAIGEKEWERVLHVATCRIECRDLYRRAARCRYAIQRRVP